MLLEAVPAAEARMFRNRYTIQNVTRVMIHATEMIWTINSKDKGEILGEMVQTVILLS